VRAAGGDADDHDCSAKTARLQTFLRRGICSLSFPFHFSIQKEIHMAARCTAPLLALVAALAFTAAARADSTVDGTWKSTFKTQDGTERTITYKFKLDGDKVTGTVSGRNNTETAIENGTFANGTLSFSVTRERNNAKVTTKYEAKLDGDTLKGSSESPGRDGGEARKRDWTATREK
jgi:hypothetical protein